MSVNGLQMPGEDRPDEPIVPETLSRNQRLIQQVFTSAGSLVSNVDHETDMLMTRVMGKIVGRVRKVLANDGTDAFHIELKLKESTVHDRQPGNIYHTLVHFHGRWAKLLAFLSDYNERRDLLHEIVLFGCRVERRAETAQDKARMEQEHDMLEEEVRVLRPFQLVCDDVPTQSTASAEMFIALHGNRNYVCHINSSNLNSFRPPGNSAFIRARRDVGVVNVPKSAAVGLTYTPINELQPNNVYNLWGVVAEFSAPTQTRGTDYLVRLTVMDESCSVNDGGLRMNIFIRDRLKAPRPAQVGDIMRFHRVKVTSYNERNQGLPASGFAFTIFPVDSDNSEPYQTYPSAARTWDNNRDSQRLEALRQWSKIAFTPKAGELNAAYLRQFRYLNRRRAVDVIARVISVGSGSNAPSLVLWDGTDLPNLSIDEGSGTLVRQPPAVPSQADRGQEVPLHGSLLNVFVQPGSVVAEAVARFSRGQWIRIAQAECIWDNAANQLALRLNDKSLVHALPPSADVAKTVEDRYRERLQWIEEGWGPRPCMSIEGYPEVHMSSIVDMHNDGQTCGRYRIRAKCTATAPRRLDLMARPVSSDGRDFSWNADAAEWVSPLGQLLANEDEDENQAWKFAFKLRLEDHSHAITATVSGQSAVELLNGPKPCDLRQPSNEGTLIHIKDKIRNLTDDGAWLVLHIYKFTPESGIVQYIVSDTALCF